MNTRVSIIICTFNREEVLCNTLRRVAVLMRNRDDAELIVVDQTRLHAAATERCLKELAGVIQLHRVEFASLTRARNYGVRHAKGEIVLFLDDDVEPVPNFIDGHLDCYDDTAVWGVGGCTLLPGRSKLSLADLSKRELRNLGQFHGHRFDLDSPRVISWTPGCNMSFRREKLFEVGGFDEAFYGSAFGEETELCSRICRAGGILQFAPAAELVHLVNPTGGCRDARAEEEGIAQLLDNAHYMLCRAGRPWTERWHVLLHQCKTIAVNWRSLKEWTWPQRCAWCIKGLRRAVQGGNREPILPLLRTPIRDGHTT